jgi:hypothetical protein
MTNPQYFPSQVISQYTDLVRDGSVQASAADAPYEFGVFPYLPLAKIRELYDPIARGFRKQAGTTGLAQLEKRVRVVRAGAQQGDLRHRLRAAPSCT